MIQSPQSGPLHHSSDIPTIHQTGVPNWRMGEQTHGYLWRMQRIVQAAAFAIFALLSEPFFPRTLKNLLFEAWTGKEMILEEQLIAHPIQPIRNPEINLTNPPPIITIPSNPPILPTEKKKKKFSETDLGPRIVQKGMNVEKYSQEEYKGNTPKAQKYIKRLKHISAYFNKSFIYPVRGDGNCFCNAALAGLVLLIVKNNEKKEKIIQVLIEYASKTEAYTTPDQSANAPAYSKLFTKEEDFETTVQFLSDGTLSSLDFENYNFTSSFSRVLRYLICCNQANAGFAPNEMSLESGSEIDMNAVVILNALFDINCKVAVLQANLNEANPVKPEEIYLIQGKDIYDNSTSIINTHQNNGDQPCDFLLIRKDAHYIVLV
ncbi:MAG: hypothetical protein H0V82_08660 [Candidatus Protochlamydia sp.]|nr:hypothetical protein [Candidatus Protochlamydia sp.]